MQGLSNEGIVAMVVQTKTPKLIDAGHWWTVGHVANFQWPGYKYGKEKRSDCKNQQTFH